MASVIYDIKLRIEYVYEYAAESSRHVVRLVPADLPGVQRVVASSLDIRPRPAEWSNHIDFFGNDYAEIAFLEPHSEISFLMQSRLEILQHETGFDVSPGLAGLGTEIEGYRSLDPFAPHHFLGSSALVRIPEAIADYARDAIAGSSTVLQAVNQVGQALNRDMTFDPEATTVETPMLEAFEVRRGVCQDFTHIMIASLRSLGIPAGYVSGFLRTIPPPGRPRLEGADAMHAWVRAWCGVDLGWVEYDPTNAMPAGTDHITIARGRDYSDIAPVRGVMRSYGEHETSQSVDVVPVER